MLLYPPHLHPFHFTGHVLGVGVLQAGSLRAATGRVRLQFPGEGVCVGQQGEGRPGHTVHYVFRMTYFYQEHHIRLILQQHSEVEK